ncbi:MAG: hypothetical protein IJ142_10485 [Bacteroidaceae bacterium]|nr:hypothetical protein [Bacteroidaceae bacterium]MBQ9192003.1 hypothetical protein [Bacteroidaceae bacterium]
MKKNLLWSILAFSMMAILGTGFISCGNDDDEDNGKGLITTSIVGSWSGLIDNAYTTMTFKNDGIGYQTWPGDDDYWVFGYSTNGSILYLFEEGEYGEFHYSVSGNTLTLTYIGENGHPTNESFTATLTKSGTPISSTKPVGTWKGNYYEEDLTLTFKNNGSGSYVYLDGSEKERGDFKWTMVTNTQGGMILNNNREVLFEIDGNMMELAFDRDGKNKFVLTKQ